MTGEAEEETNHDELVRGLAEITVACEKIARNQQSLKEEFKTIVPRLDAIDARIGTLAAEIGQMSDRLHKANNLITAALDETTRVHQEHAKIGDLVDQIESELRGRTTALARSHKSLERMLEVLEGRVGLLRKAITSEPPAAPRDESTPSRKE